MSRCDVDLPPAIRSNYGSDHLLVRRAEKTILYLNARSRLHLICGLNGTAGQLSPSMMKGQDHTLVKCPHFWGIKDYGLTLIQSRRNLEGKKRPSEEINQQFVL